MVKIQWHALTSASSPFSARPSANTYRYHNIWQKVRNIWKYIYDNYMDDYDYFVIGGQSEERGP